MPVEFGSDISILWHKSQALNSAAKRHRKHRMDINDILSSYPRTRPPLSAAHQKVYVEQYKINREGSTTVDHAAQKLERWMHRRVALSRGGPILELGAGTLNHLKFETTKEPYDIVEPFSSLYKGKDELARIRAAYDSVKEVPKDNRYRRIISIAVLEHLTDLPADVAKSATLLKQDGVFQAGIPSEGGVLWWLGWRLSTGLGFYLRTGLDYGVVMRHEHINNAREIIAVVSHFFERVTLVRFPTPFSQLSFYSYIEAQQPRRAIAQEFLEKAGRRL